MVEQLIGDIRIALENRLYSVALIGALTLPDICAAKDAPDGRASKERYIAWLECYLDLMLSESLSSANIYAARCQVIHQGDVEHYEKEGFFRWLVQDAEGNEVFFPNDPAVWTGKFGGLYLSHACEELCLAAERWLEKEGGG